MSDDIKKYTSIYEIKDYALNVLGPKYFPEDVIEGYNIGFLGYTLDLMTNVTEDIFNTVPIVINEMFPNLAQMPSSIYNYASLFQYSNLMATPSTITCVLLLPMDTLLEYSELSNDGTYKIFKLDQRTEVRVEDQSFILEYDILVTMRPYRGEQIITASYIRDYNNDLSEVVNPYIKYQKFNYNGVKYLALLVKMRRCEKSVYETRIINNDRINASTINITFNDQLANFEVFYKESTDNKYTQLKKKILNSRAIDDPFCYYRLKTDDTLEISFTTKENYFKPKFNSEILVEYYTTDGENGNFERYLGNNVEVYRNSEKYENNNRVPIIAIPQTASTGGKNKPTLMNLRDMAADAFATVDSYTTESDLQRHFNSFDITNQTKVHFIKKRDDIFDRLYTAFSISKDSLGSYYKTNTLQLKIYKDQFDHQFEQSKRLLLKPSNVFIYNGVSTKQMVKVEKDDIYDLGFNNTFIYQNPFLMTLSDNGIVGYYLNNINSDIILDYEYANDNSMIQMICNSMSVHRSSISKDNSYKFKLHMTATDYDIKSPITDDDGNPTGNLKVLLTFVGKNGKELGYVECKQTDYDYDNKRYTFEAEVFTDDYISTTEAVRLYGLKDMIKGEDLVQMVPMTNLKMNIYTLFAYEDGNLPHALNHLPDYKNTTMTNIYTTEENRVELVTPLNMLRSVMSWEDDEEGNPYILIKDVPVMKWQEMIDEEYEKEFDRFMNILSSQYDYMNEILYKKTNNYSVDMKFYNTYGRSNNFIYGEEQNILNRVNCTVHFKVYPTIRSEGAKLVQDMKMFIKEYFESINAETNEGIYISNLIQQLENTFSNIKYLKFESINGYDNDIQNIENLAIDVTTLSKEEKIEFVPEYLNIELEDIIIDLIN